MKYTFSGVTNLSKYPSNSEDITFTDPNEADAFLQKIYEDICYAAPLVDKITQDEIKIIVDIV